MADRLLERAGGLSERDMQDQMLDSLDLERERGITIKLQAVRLDYRARDGQQYVLNLIDTPGHVDFSYEVSRSLAACEGALLVVDATQGVEAQTLANCYLALEHGLEIIPVINKIDLPNSDPDRVLKEIEDNLGLDVSNAIMASARTGEGAEDILEAIVEQVSPPEGDPDAPLRALIFDSHYDPYRGVVAYVRVVDGVIDSDTSIRMMSTKASYEVAELGTFEPDMVTAKQLGPGEVGAVLAGMRNVRDTRIGDTMTDDRRPASEALPGYRPIQPMVFCGLYPVDNDDFRHLRDALERLQLNDSALHFEADTSGALGFGFRSGFLGLLHMEIVQERLEREFDLDLITTAPSVVYHVVQTNEEIIEVDNPADFPDPGHISWVEEPFVKATMVTPSEYIGPLMELCQGRRGTFVDLEYLTPERARLVYEMPLNEILMDFYDRLKTHSRGYASLDYESIGYREGNLVKMDILLSGEPVDALSSIVHEEKAQARGRALAEKLREVIPRQLFEVPIQAAIGQRVIARETVRAMRKDVLAKCYGGDVSRKRKLLERQREGKRRMKQLGRVEVPQEAFMAVLRID